MLLTASLFVLMPLLASAQSYPAPTDVTMLDTTVAYGYFPLQYYLADKDTTIRNSVNFPGYNYTPPVDFDAMEGETNSSETWSLEIRYSRVTVQDKQGNTTVGNTVLALNFPEEQWPINSTDWQLCASYVAYDFPASISSRSGANASDSSCTPYFGESCAAALSEQYRLQSLQQVADNCPFLPAFSTIPECEDVAKLINDEGGTYYQAVTNTTDPNLIHYEVNNTWVDVNTGTTYRRDNLTYQGLESGQGFGYKSRVLAQNQSNTDALSLAESRKLQMIGFQIVPSDRFIANSPTGGYVAAGNPRLLCGRAKPIAGTGATSSATGVVSASGTTKPPSASTTAPTTSAAPDTLRTSVAIIILALAAAMVPMLGWVNTAV